MLKFGGNLSAIHAYLCADGYVIKNPLHQKHKYYHIGFRNTSEVLLKDFEDKFYIHFKIKCRRSDGRVITQNKEVYNKLTENYSYYSSEWTIPRLSKENLRYWLRAFFDCEGWVVVKKGQDRRIGLDSVNHKGAYNIMMALKYFGIQSKIRFLEKRGMSRLNILGRDNLVKFQKEIGFLHPDKKKKLDEAINSYVDYEWRFPNERESLKIFVLSILKEKLRVKNNGILRIDSINKSNLLLLSKTLHDLFGIGSKVYGPWRSSTSCYYELCIQQQPHVIITKKLLLCSTNPQQPE